MSYVDVFVSHKKENTTEAKRLKSRIQKLGYTCYIDADDPSLKETKSAEQMAELIRSHLRQCRCLIFVYSQQAIESKWMPWELGFFDGRWGNRSIGLYILDKGPHRKAGDPPRDESRASFSVQEYLEMYEQVDDKTLPDFLHRNTSTTALLNRADVDVDRFMTLLIGATRNPIDFYLGCTQYYLGISDEFFRRLGLSSKTRSLPSGLPTIQEFLGTMRRMAPAPKVPDVRASVVDPVSDELRAMHEAGVLASIK